MGFENHHNEHHHNGHHEVVAAIPFAEGHPLCSDPYNGLFSPCRGEMIAPEDPRYPTLIKAYKEADHLVFEHVKALSK